MSEFKGIVSLKRKRYWVTRWIEINSSTVLYRDKQADQIKRIYLINDCDILMQQEDKSVILKSGNEKVLIKFGTAVNYQLIKKILLWDSGYYKKSLVNNCQEMPEYQNNQYNNDNTTIEPFENQSLSQAYEHPALKRYYKLADSAKEFFHSVQQLNTEWKLLSDRKGFKIHTRLHQESGFTLTKAEGIIPFEKEKILEIIQDIPNNGNFDILFESGYIVDQFNDNLSIIYQQFKSIRIFKSRDFVIMTRVYRSQDSILVIAKSVEYESVPPSEDNIQRAELMMSGWLLRSVDNQSTNTCFISLINPRGMSPFYLSTDYSIGQGQCVENICKLLMTRNK